MKKTIIFKSNEDIIFERTDTKNRSRIAVRYGEHFIHDYRFNNTKGIEFESPYISWENLNCCGGWTHDKEYLKTAVQENKKICAGISFKTADEIQEYIKGIDKEKYDYVDTSWDNGPYRFHLIDLVKKGSLRDYYDLKEIIDFYKILGLNWDSVDVDRFNELYDADLFDLINGSKGYKYSEINKTIGEHLITGLLLGYPLESTAGPIV